MTDAPDYQILADDAIKARQQGTPLQASEAIPLTKLDYALKNLTIGLGWEGGTTGPVTLDVDLSAFVLDRHNQTRDDDDFIFYNHPSGAAGAVKHMGDHGASDNDQEHEIITIDLAALPFDAVKMVLALSVHEADLKDQHIGMVKNPYLRLVNADTQMELLRYNMALNGDKLSYAALLADLERGTEGWIFVARGRAVPGGLAGIATQYGLMVSG